METHPLDCNEFANGECPIESDVMEIICTRNLTVGEAATSCGGRLRMTGRLKDSIGEEILNTNHILKCEKCGTFWNLSIVEGPREI